MNNFNHANDKLNAPLCNSNDDGNQFSNKMHHLKNLLRLLELAYEGHSCSQNYANTDVTEMLQAEGTTQQALYLRLFDEALSGLDDIYCEMQRSNSNMEGK